jgi:tRNA A-37 threonylcarbamoyl transferase component Bud32
MHDYKISHGDMKLSNFIYESDLLHVLDLDSMERFTSARRFHTRFTKDLARFRKNWVGTKHEASVDQLIQAADSSQAEKPKVR